VFDDVGVERAAQLTHGPLVRRPGRGRHEQLTPDDLVAQSVVREVADLFGGVAWDRERHTHKMSDVGVRRQLGTA